MKKWLFAFLILLAAPAVSRADDTIAAISVAGAQRIEDTTILS